MLTYAAFQNVSWRDMRSAPCHTGRTLQRMGGG
jgi:hypothetical protein